MKDHSERFIQMVDQTIRLHRMFGSGDRVLIGVSGGPDSLALLRALIAIAPEWHLTFGVAHLNHQLRGAASDNDAQFVANVAKTFKLPLFTEKKDVGAYGRKNRLSLETAAREVRYAFFDRVAESNGFNKIALGHHMNDNAELILMNFLRGSGPAGMAGIPPVRSNRIVRPLIGTTRDQIMAYLDAKKLSYVMDESNVDRKYLRNRVRHDLIPHLMSVYNPRLVERLHQMADIFRMENRWMANKLSTVYDQVILEQQPFSITYSISGLLLQEDAVIRRLVRGAYGRLVGDTKKLTYEHVEAVRGLLRTGYLPKSLDLPRQIRVYRDDQTLIIRREKTRLRHTSPKYFLNESVSFHYTVNPPDMVTVEETGVNLQFSIETIRYPFRTFLKNDPVAYMDADQVSTPVIIRNYRVSDRFAPLGLGGSQTVTKYLGAREKNRRKRAKCPVMESDGQVVWVVGYGIADRVKITDQTRRMLKVVVSLA